MRDGLYPRYAEARLLEALADTPAVLIHGPRQSGKTTLALKVARAARYEYYSFDDGNLLRAAREDAAGFVAELPPRAVLDEVQRVPELFSALKLSIDRERRPGRFILTGSANVLLVPKLADSPKAKVWNGRCGSPAMARAMLRPACSPWRIAQNAIAGQAPPPRGRWT